jgi:hypothetical protein
VSNSQADACSPVLYEIPTVEDYIRWSNTGVLDKDINYKEQRLFSLSRETAFGRLDIITQTKCLHLSDEGIAKTEVSHGGEIGRRFEAKAVITPFKSQYLLPQFVFTVEEQTVSGFLSLSTPTLSCMWTRPDDSDVFQVAKYGSLVELEVMFHNGLASLTDCDTKGRSLLNVSLMNPTPTLESVAKFRKACIRSEEL